MSNNKLEIFYGVNSSANSGSGKTIKERVSSLEETLSNEIHARESADTDLSYKISNINSKINDINSNIDNINTDIVTIENNQVVLNNQINNLSNVLEQTIKSTDEAIIELNNNHDRDISYVNSYISNVNSYISNINTYIDSIKEEYLKEICINNSYGKVTSPNLASVTLDGSYLEVGPEFNSYLEGAITAYDSITTAISKLSNMAGTTGFEFDDMGDIDGITIK